MADYRELAERLLSHSYGPHGLAQTGRLALGEIPDGLPSAAVFPR